MTFSYPDARVPGTYKTRTVEPYRVLLRSGNFYLVAYDRGARDWRTFALDRFHSLPKRAGSNNFARTIPPEYASDDVLGFIKSGGPPVEVAIELNARVAASATSRQWQTGQRVEILGGGRARIFFSVSNLYEVVRWAFGGFDDRLATRSGRSRSEHSAHHRCRSREAYRRISCWRRRRPLGCVDDDATTFLLPTALGYALLSRCRGLADARVALRSDDRFAPVR